ncbi:MAG: 23S rRNA (uracil(1939)-C(5))-methyltransferase RlmD [Gammaproteobacteria bacterium]|nr:23S rRNA (uracil(1939)-C(5))-methyltransferase RlmD [Gammaproteobacteria bacterium]
MNANAASGGVRITGLTHDGRGVARGPGKALFVPGALPGETVSLGRRYRHRRYDEAELAQILTPAPERVAPECPHFGVCGGCRLQHMAPQAQREAKERQLAETLERIGRVRPGEWWPTLEGPDYGYRRCARFGVRFVEKKGRLLVGFRETNGRYVTDARVCPAMVAVGVDLPAQLAALIDDLTARRSIPQVEFAAGDNDAALVFRVLEPLESTDAERLISFGRRHGFAVWVQTGGPDSLRLLYGSPLLAYALPEFDVTLHCLPTDFMQINAAVNRQLVAVAVERMRLDGTQRVLELFSGIGNFSLALARKAREVVAVEGNAKLVRRAVANARANGMANVRHHQADLSKPGEAADWQTGPCDAVLLDPPRSGARELLPLLIRLAPARIFYVSCHPATLARDAAALVEAGWRLRGAGTADMFPQTAHVEALALFERG